MPGLSFINAQNLTLTSDTAAKPRHTNVIKQPDTGNKETDQVEFFISQLIHFSRSS